MSDYELKNEDVLRAAIRAAASQRPNYDVGQVEVSGATGLDALFSQESQILSPFKTAGRKKIASLSELNGFTRTASDTLIHKSDQELWSLKKEADGTYFIERLFSDGDPLKG